MKAKIQTEIIDWLYQNDVQKTNANDMAEREQMLTDMIMFVKRRQDFHNNVE